MTMHRVSFLAHGGRVQGVNFRSFTQQKAQQYGITGWVRNTSDEKVEGEAQGAEEDIKQLLEHLKEGPSHATVVKLENSHLQVVDGEKVFEVR